MDCEFVRDNLSSFHDGEMPSELGEEFRRHLCHCEDCQRELLVFEKLGELVSKDDSTDVRAGSAAARHSAEELWRKIESRLEGQSRNPVTALSSISRGQFALGALLAIAASLVFVGWLTPPASHNHRPQLASAVIDFGEILMRFDGTPNRTLGSLAARFPVKKVSNDAVEESLGFRPAASGELPAGVRLVSTVLVEMPSCQCAQGQCACGPGGCHCAASVCQREDGSIFLVLEHCKSQSISFGDLPSKIAVGRDRELQLIETTDQLAVSWIADHRRLTAIGLRGTNEAETLVAKLSQPPSFN